jgi:hypothetical protein
VEKNIANIAPKAVVTRHNLHNNIPKYLKENGCCNNWNVKNEKRSTITNILKDMELIHDGTGLFGLYNPKILSINPPLGHKLPQNHLPATKADIKPPIIARSTINPRIGYFQPSTKTVNVIKVIIH